MTQPIEEGAVGGADESIIAAEPTLEQRLSAALDEEGDEPIVGDGEPGEPGGPDPDDATGEEAEELPPIQPPVSWRDEEKEEFRSLPRALQETLTRRETERERFVQLKSQEAAQTRSAVERQALEHIQQLQAQTARQLAHYAAQFEMPEPDPQLIVEDPETYALQLQQHRYAAAQRHQAQQQAEYAAVQAQQAEAAVRAQEAQDFQARLIQEFPEFLSPENAKLREQLGSIAIELGYPADQLQHVDATDVLAMRRASEWKAKASKYDALMAKQMERVRSARELPKVSKPGVAVGRGAAESSRYQADRSAMKSGDTEAAKRVFARFI